MHAESRAPSVKQNQIHFSPTAIWGQLMNHSSNQMNFTFPHGKQEHTLSLQWWVLDRPQRNWFFLNRALLAVRKVMVHRSCEWQSGSWHQAPLFAIPHWYHKAKWEAGWRNLAEIWQDRWTSGRAQQGHWIRTNVMDVTGSLRKQFSFLFPDLTICGSGCILTPAPSAFTSNPDNYPHATRRGKRVLLKSGPWLQFQPYQQLHNFSVTSLITEEVICSPKQSTDLGFEVCALKTWAMWPPYILIVLAQQKASKSILFHSRSKEILNWHPLKMQER